MKNSIVALILFFSFSLKGQENANKWINTSILGSTEDVVFVGEIENGMLNFGVYQPEAGFVASNMIELIGFEDNKVPIEKVIYADNKVFVFGHAETDKGVNFYWGVTGEGKAPKVSGELFYQVNNKNGILGQFYTLSKDKKLIGLSVLEATNTSNLIATKVVTFNLDLEVLNEKEFEFLSDEYNDANSQLFEMFLSDKQNLVVYSELVNGNGPVKYQTVVINFGKKQSSKTIISDHKKIFSSCELDMDEQGNLLLVGFPIGSNETENWISGVTVVRVNSNGKVKWGNVGLDEISKQELKGYNSRKPEEPIISKFCKIEKAWIDERGNSMIMLVDENYEITKDLVNYSGDLYVMCLDSENRFNWNTWLVVNSKSLNNNHLNELFMVAQRSSKMNTFSKVNKGSVDVFMRRPMLDKMNEESTEILYRPFWVTINLDHGNVVGQERNLNNNTLDKDFLGQYIMFKETKN